MARDLVGRVAAILVLSSVSSACDRFERQPGGVGGSAPIDPRERMKEPATEMLRAAEVATSTCVAGDLLWEEEATEEVGPKHYSRPCIPEVCAPAPAALDALRASVAKARAALEADSSLKVPSTEGLVQLGEAMVAFVDASATASKTAGASSSGPPFSGISMHHRHLVGAYAKLYPEPRFPEEPPSLAASLDVPLPGGDVCKGWGNPKYCDVAAVKVPALRRWRPAPACIEVESIKKAR